jgi:hypothetical protein
MYSLSDVVATTALAVTATTSIFGLRGVVAVYPLSSLRSCSTIFSLMMDAVCC